MNRNHFFICTAAIMFVNTLLAQTSTNASGNNASGIGGSASYSVGQIVYTSNSNSSGTVEQGVQHAYEFLSVGISSNEFDIKLSVFPNPVSDNISLSIADLKSQKLSFQLMDALGKIIESRTISENITSIDASYLPKATYLLTVFDSNNTIIHSFKIIKS